MKFRATVVDIRLEGRVDGRQRFQVLLDRTEFRVGDVGKMEAVAPSGARLVAPILRVVADDDGELWHVVEKPLAAETEVTAHVERAAVEQKDECGMA